LVHTACRNLDRDAISRAQIKFFIAVVNLRDGSPRYIQATPENFDVLFMATGAVPILAREVLVAGELAVDGGVYDPLPAIPALEMGFDHLVVITNRFRGLVTWHEQILERGIRLALRPGIRRRLSLPSYQAIHKTFLARRSRYESTHQKLWQLSTQGRAIIITPPDQLPTSWIDSSADRVARAFDVGYQEGIQRRSEVNRFLEQLAHAD
jgi:predicted patatin/cPLA2 family phospholipase